MDTVLLLALPVKMDGPHAAQRPVATSFDARSHDDIESTRTFAKEGKSRWPTTTKSKMIIRNGYHEPNNNTAIWRLEASMMQTVSQERHPLNRCCALNLRFDRAASEDHGTLPVEPNLGDYPQTPDLRSIGWRSRKQHNAAQYLLHLISFV